MTLMQTMHRIPKQYDRLSVCLKPKFGRLKPKFDDDAEGGSAKRTRGPEKLSSAPRSTSSI